MHRAVLLDQYFPTPENNLQAARRVSAWCAACSASPYPAPASCARLSHATPTRSRAVDPLTPTLWSDKNFEAGFLVLGATLTGISVSLAFQANRLNCLAKSQSATHATLKRQEPSRARAREGPSPFHRFNRFRERK